MNQSISVLLVDDSPEDIELTIEALEGTKLANNVFIVNDGVEALQFLRHQGKFAQVPRPSLVLLDLNMPKMDGRETLSEMKKDLALMDIPVVILTTSSDGEDIVESYKLHANCYVTKPVDMRQFCKVVQAIDNFWFAVAELPPNSKPHMTPS